MILSNFYRPMIFGEKPEKRCLEQGIFDVLLTLSFDSIWQMFLK
jgi:hypothetical protein